MAQNTFKDTQEETVAEETVAVQPTPSNVVHAEAEIQTEKTSEDIARLHTELNAAYSTIHALQEKIERTAPFTEHSMHNVADDCIKHTLVVCLTSRYHTKNSF